jgi:hypothetical protein
MAPGEERETDLIRPLFRFVVGLWTLTGERLGAILAAPSAAGVPAPPLPDSRPERSTPRHVALGLALRALDHARRTPARLGARLARATVPARRLAAPLSRLLARAPGAGRARAQLDLWRTRGQAAVTRLAIDGAREEVEGRAMARAALTTIREQAFASLSESPDLKQVIRDQSEGVAVTAVTELRDRSARADTMAEGAVRRLLGRRPTGG